MVLPEFSGMDEFSSEDLSKWCYEKMDFGARIKMGLDCQKGVVDFR